MTQTTRTPVTHVTTDPVLVLGATGKTGRRVVDRLQATGRDVRAASRRSAARFDWDDRSTWAGALEGTASVYIALPLTAVPVGEFVDQAVASGVRRLVALSGRGADRWENGFGQEMLDLEHAVRESGVEWSILRASNFAQNFHEDVFFDSIMAGELVLPVGGVPEPFIDVEDVADVAVAMLTEDTWVGRIVETTGPESLTWGEAVATVARESGRDIRFVDISPEEYTTLLTAQGLSEADAYALDTMFAELRRGLLTDPTDGIRDVLGREPRAFADYAARASAAGAWD